MKSDSTIKDLERKLEYYWEVKRWNWALTLNIYRIESDPADSCFFLNHFGVVSEWKKSLNKEDW